MNTDKIFAYQTALQYSKPTSSKAKALKRLDDWIKKPSKTTSIVIGLLSICLFIAGLLFRFYLLDLFAIIGFIVNPFIFIKILYKRKKENENDILLLAQDVIDE